MSEPHDLTLTLLRELRGSLAKLDEKFEERFSKLDDKVDKLRQDVAHDFAQVRGELGHLRLQQDQIHYRIDRLEERLGHRIEALEKRLDADA